MTHKQRRVVYDAVPKFTPRQPGESRFARDYRAQCAQDNCNQGDDKMTIRSLAIDALQVAAMMAMAYLTYACIAVVTP